MEAYTQSGAAFSRDRSDAGSLSLARRANQPVILLLLLAGCLHGWMIAHTHLPARDTIGYVRYALLLESRPLDQALRQIEQHPLYPLCVLAVSVPVRQVVGDTTASAMVLSAQAVSGLAA